MSSSRKDERNLVRRLKARDERAFTEFMEHNQDRVFNLVYRLVGDRAEAEDVSQEVFISVFKTIGSFREESKLSTWLFTVAANHAKNRIKYLARRQINRRQSLDDTTENELLQAASDSIPSPDGLAIGQQMERLVQVALTSLEEEHRLVVVLRDVEHLSYEDIADITGVAIGTVKSRLHRARAALRQTLKRLEKRRSTP